MDETQIIIDNPEVPVYNLDLVRERSLPYKRVTRTESVAQILHSLLDKSPVEQFVTIYMDANGNMAGAERIAIGDLLMVALNMKSLFRGAIVSCCPTIIMGHNHLYDNPTPSDQDLLLTTSAIQVGRIVGIEVFDHVIVSPNGTHYSLWDHQYDIAHRMANIAYEKEIDKILGSHPFVDPLLPVRHPAPKDRFK